MREAGLEVELDIAGRRLGRARPTPRCPPTASCRRHSRTSSVTRNASRCEIGARVTSRSSPSRSPTTAGARAEAETASGHGIRGMRERVEALGGSFAAGPARAPASVCSDHPRCHGGVIMTTRVSSSTTRRSCAPASECSLTQPTTSRSSARPRTASEASPWPPSSPPTSSSWISACPRWTGSRPRARFLPEASEPRAAHPRAHHLRRRRVRLRGAALGGERLSAQGHRARPLVDGRRGLAAGDALLSPSVTRRLIGEFASTTRGARRSPRGARRADRARARGHDARRTGALKRTRSPRSS